MLTINLLKDPMDIFIVRIFQKLSLLCTCPFLLANLILTLNSLCFKDRVLKLSLKNPQPWLNFYFEGKKEQMFTRFQGSLHPFLTVFSNYVQQETIY